MLRQFLREARSRISLNSQEQVTVVLGNESCDLDSAVSAVVYAFFLSHFPSEHPGASKTRPVLPMLNVIQKEFKIKTEVNYVFRKYLFGPDESHDEMESELIFRDSLDLESLHAIGHLDLRLVDHNSLSSDQQHLSSAVRGIVDHHVATPATLGIKDFRLESVGSCATLIAEIGFDSRWMDSSFPFPAEAGHLLMSAILTDTNGLKEGIGKTTTKDKIVVGRLEQEILGVKPDDSKAYRKAVKKAVKKAKSDVSGLTAAELLVKDMKTSRLEGASMLMATLPLSRGEFLKILMEQKVELYSVLSSVAEEKAVDLIVIYTSWTVEEDGRTLFFFSESSELRKRAVDAVLQTTDFVPDLTALDLNATNVDVYVQGNRAVTRKQIMPLLERLFSQKQEL